MSSELSMISKMLTYTAILVLLLLPTTTTSSPSNCDNRAKNMTTQSNTNSNKREALKFKLISISSILTSGALGVSLPLLSKKIPNLQPESDIFFMIKAFAAGVILATGFVHILPDAFNNLHSPCLKDNPWGKFPFTGFVAMLSSIGTLMVDSFATGYYKRAHFSSVKDNNKHDDDIEKKNVVHVVNGVDNDGAHDGHVHVHTHATHGHAHGSNDRGHLDHREDLLRHRVVSQVLELGIVVHSVIIGISLGASQNPDTIKPLLAALSFHQFFEGMGLGGCISQAKFKSRSMLIMALCFSLTTPAGIGIGIGVSSFYSANSATALIVEGIFNAASAGILIYMALVDILAADFMNPKMQSNIRLQLGSYTSLLLGSGCMSVLAKWA